MYINLLIFNFYDSELRNRYWKNIGQIIWFLKWLYKNTFIIEFACKSNLWNHPLYCLDVYSIPVCSMWLDKISITFLVIFPKRIQWKITPSQRKVRLIEIVSYLLSDFLPNPIASHNIQFYNYEVYNINNNSNLNTKK